MILRVGLHDVYHNDPHLPKSFRRINLSPGRMHRAAAVYTPHIPELKVNNGCFTSRCPPGRAGSSPFVHIRRHRPGGGVATIAIAICPAHGRIIRADPHGHVCGVRNTDHLFLVNRQAVTNGIGALDAVNTLDAFNGQTNYGRMIFPVKR